MSSRTILIFTLICFLIIILSISITTITTNTQHINPCNDTLTDEEYINHMIPHHEVAVHMSKQLISKTKNPIMLNILRNIIRIQLYEISLMKDSALKNNHFLNDDMSDSNIKMNTDYYPSQGDFVKPNVLGISNTYCDPSFFSITPKLHNMTDETYMKHMIPHHQVAVDMSKKILQTTSNDFIIFLAYEIIRSQQPEIAELTNLLQSADMFKSNIL